MSRYARQRWAVAAFSRTGSCRWKVDAGPLLGRLDALMASGWSLRAIARAADVSYPTLISIRQGRRGRRRRQCWNTIADSVFALELDPTVRAR
jgi:hypothetical protein